MRTLIIGLGNIGMGYDYELDDSHIQTHARAVCLHNSFELAGGVDLCQNKREKFENLYKAKSFKNLPIALQEVMPDLVIISTPSPTHFDTLKTVFKFSIPEIILCERHF